MNGKRWAAVIIAVGLFFVSVVYQLGISGSGEQLDNVMEDDMFSEKVIEQGDLTSKIAVINLEGVIEDTGEAPFMSSFSYNHKGFLRMLEKAGEDETVEGIVLNVNSPGGGVVESAEIHDKIVEIQQEYEKPVYATMGNTAASGGYYVSAPADKIIAHPATLTGSIGVIMESINISEFADDFGIDFDTIKSGEYKDIMSPSRPMTENEEDILQSMVDDMYDDFVQVIVDGRDMSEEKVKDIGDGRVYTGKQAHELELVDELGNMDDTIGMMEEDYDVSGAQVIEYEPGFSIGGLFNLSSQKLFGSDPEVQNIINLLRDSSGPRAMYLYAE